jgi:hypothetical protein
MGFGLVERANGAVDPSSCLDRTRIYLCFQTAWEAKHTQLLLILVKDQI